MTDTVTLGGTDVAVFWSLAFDNAKACEHDLHASGSHGHADGTIYYCVLSCACTEARGVILRCDGFIEWCTENEINCDQCNQEVPEGFPWHIRIQKVE